MSSTGIKSVNRGLTHYESVDGLTAVAVAVATPLPVTAVTGVAAADLGKAEDAVHNSGDVGVSVLSVRRDTAASTAGTDGDYAAVTTDGTGRTWVNTEMPDAAALADTVANPTTPTVGSFPSVYNGTTWDRQKSASAANASAFSGAGAGLVAMPGQWTVTHAPSSATQAIASKSAGSTGVRHVATNVIVTLCGGAAAPTAALVTVNLRDGASGAGSILATFTMAIAGVAGQCNVLSIPGLNVVGSAATAMTLETSAATGTNVSASATLTGYDVA